MRNEDSSTLQYSSLIPLTDLLAFIPCCSPVSHSSTRPLYSTWSFKLKCDLGTEYDERFGFQDRIYTPLSTVREKNRSEDTLLPGRVTGITEIMRAPYAVIILMNLVESGFIAQLKQSIQIQG